jgi:parallel beta-helix repeat protein
VVRKAEKLRRVVSIIFIVLLFLGLSTFAFFVQPAKAQSGTIYINPDGSVSPSTAPIKNVGNTTYTFTSDIVNDSIVVERSNIVVDGARYTVQGTGTSLSQMGMNLTGRSNVTIENVKITAFYYGIYLYSSSKCTVLGNNITTNKYNAGVYLDNSPYNIVSGNNITSNGYYGLYLYYSSNCTVLGNNITNNWKYGLYLDYSSNSTVSKNTLTNNGLYVWQSFHNVVVNNSVNGKPLVYLEHVSGYAVSDAGQVVLVNCKGISVNNLNLSYVTIELWQTNNTRIANSNITDNWWDGVDIWYSSNCTVSGGSITYSGESGVDLESSPNCTVSNNNIANNGYGILLDSSFDNVSGNTITNSDYGGIGLYSSSNCTVSGNMFTNDGLYVEASFENVVVDNLVEGKPLVYLEHVSDYAVSDAGQVVLVNCKGISVNNLNLSYATVGLELWQTNNTIITDNNFAKDWQHGIWLQSSLNCTVLGNNMTNNGWSGIWLSSSSNCTVSRNNIANTMDDGVDIAYSSNNNTISENTIMNNYCGVELRDYSSNNRFFHNDFDGNTQQVISDGLQNTWDDGYPSGGNYWSSYTGVDLKNGSSQNQTGSDGIGDTPYVIDTNNTDHYPLMGTFYSFSVYLQVPPFNVTVISNSTVTGLHAGILLETQGRFIWFNVTGRNGSTGFCRVSIPTAMMKGTFTVYINGTEIPYSLLPCSDANVSYLYFNYKHSTEQVSINVPEFPPFLFLLLTTITVLGAVVLKKERVDCPFSSRALLQLQTVNRTSHHRARAKVSILPNSATAHDNDAARSNDPQKATKKPLSFNIRLLARRHRCYHSTAASHHLTHLRLDKKGSESSNFPFSVQVEARVY